jgi:DNA polymerase I-like protein with 3'-5' exonuclease and polymerase domains
MKTKTYFIGKYKVDGVEDYATIDECYQFIKNKRLLGLDIETTRKFQKRKESKSDVYKGGLDPYLSNVVMLQIGNLEKIYVIDVRDYTQWELSPILDFINWNKECTFIGVNLKFEGKHLRHKYGLRLKKVWDCMIAEMCLYNGIQRSFSLAGMAYEYLDVKKVEDINLFERERESTLNDDFIEENEHLLTPFEIANSEQIDKSTRMQFVTIGTKKFTAKQILYGSDDILYPILIMERQLLGRKLSNGEVYMPQKLFRMENSFTQCIADMELNGMPFSKEVWLGIANEQKTHFDIRLAELNSYIEYFYPKFVEPANLFGYEQRCMIQWSSSTQVVELFRYLEICPKEFSKQTKKQDWTVGATALLKTLKNEFKTNYQEQTWIGFEKDENGNFIEDHQRLILAYLLFKRSEQNITTFGKEWLKYVHPITHRVHTNFRQILNSGRMASSAPNVQQIPGGVYRDAFKVLDEKNTLIFADFSNQEVRTVACLAEEDVLLDFFINGHPIYGEDNHTYTANNMNKAHNPDAEDFPANKTDGFTKFHKKKRDEAKIISFGLLYGKEAKGFAEDFGLTKDEAQVFIDNYFGAYPKLKQAMDKWATHTFKNKYIQIDQVVDRRWFNDDFEEMERVNEQAKEYYPEEYFQRGKMSGEEKASLKEEINEKYPELKNIWRKYFGIRGSLQRKSTNYRIQGTSSSETKTALIMMRNELIEKKIDDVQLIVAVHDEIGLESFNPERNEFCMEFIQRNMTDGANIFLNPPIMKAEAVQGDHWIH